MRLDVQGTVANGFVDGVKEVCAQLDLPQVIEENIQVIDIQSVRTAVTVTVRQASCDVEGTVETQVTYTCSRCLEPFAAAVNGRIDAEYAQSPQLGHEYWIRDGFIDLAPAVEEAVNVALDPLPVCKQDCLGLCPACGCNRNRDACDCVSEPGDARWEALSELRLNRLSE